MPDPAATFSGYDPWTTFCANAGKYRTVQQPYLDLLELDRALQQDQAKGIRPTALEERLSGPVVGPPTPADERIRDWCTKHGPLGIVPVLSTLVQLEVVADHTARASTQAQYVRDGDRWHQETAAQSDWLSTREASAQQLHERATASPGTVTWFNFGTRAYDTRPLETLKDFFPHLAGGDPFRPPRPLTEAFWHGYAEPVWELNTYCRLFGRAAEYLMQWNDDVPTHEQDPTVRRASLFLKDLAQNVALDDVEDTRRSAGLLASHALMLLMDRTDGRRCLHCAKCDRYFVSNDRQARYCSPRCRNAAQSQRHRNRPLTPSESAGSP